ncbi:inositol monophosphatase [Candidatus Gracilibacteria bacterium]|nr:inositol monophosphatase [Candidatus Gracilibacteria bacterium]
MNILSLCTGTVMEAGLLSLDLADDLQISEKAENDWVTNADGAVEEFIIQRIHSHFPDHGILAEESFANNIEELSKKEYVWIIDPIDGTKNYARQLPIYGISIAVFKNSSHQQSKNFHYLSGELVAGAVYVPRLSELFYAEKGGGAFYNNKQITVSNTPTLKTSILATGFPPGDKTLSLKYFNKAAKHTAGIRRMGAASVDLCYTAAGRLDGFFEFALKPWDIAAGALILSEARGQITDINGNPLDLFSGDLLATNGLIHQETLDLFSGL